MNRRAFLLSLPAVAVVVKALPAPVPDPGTYSALWFAAQQEGARHPVVLTEAMMNDFLQQVDAQQEDTHAYYSHRLTRYVSENFPRPGAESTPGI